MAKWVLGGNTGVLAVHAALLRTGKILMFSGDEHDPHRDASDVNADPGPPTANDKLASTELYDCATGIITRASSPLSTATGRVVDLFCSGHCLLPDGRLLVVGGTANPYAPLYIPAGIDDSVIFDPQTETWSNTGVLRVKRWYPTLVTTAQRVLCFGGTRNHGKDPISLIESTSAAAPSAWQPAIALDHDVHFHHASWYPRLHELPSGELISASAAWDRGLGGHSHESSWNTYSYSTATDRWDDHAALGAAPISEGHEGGTSVLLPLVPPNYEARILVAGLSVPQVLDLSVAEGAAWRDWYEIDGGTAAPFKALAVLSRHASDTSLYVIGNDNVVRTTYWTGAWHGFTALPALPGAGAVTDLNVQKRSTDHAEVYVVRGGRVLRSTWTSAAPAWSAWQDLGGPPGLVAGSLAVMTRGAGDASQYVVGSGGVFTRWEGASGWVKVTAQDPAWPSGVRITAHREEPGRVWLFGVAGGVVRFSRWTTGAPAWTAWTTIPAPAGVTFASARVAALSRQAGDVSLYAVDTAGNLWTTWLRGGSFAEWTSLEHPGTALSAVEVLSRHGGDASIYAVTTGGALHSRFWNGSWNPWFALPDHGRLRTTTDAGAAVPTSLRYTTTAVASPVVLSRHSGDASIYALHNGRVLGSWWSPSARWRPEPRTTWREPGISPPAPPPHRRHACAVLLPTGEVLINGGCKTERNEHHLPGLSNETLAVNQAEIYDWEAPADARWRMVASPAVVNRNYHSVALLMPDGRVFTAGSSRHGKYSYQPQSGGSPDLDERDPVTGQIDNRERRIEIFEPDYVTATRPVITAAPSTLAIGGSMTVTTAQASSITRVAIVRAGSTTHSFDSDQRYVVLTHTASAGALTVQAPPSASIAPPGYYLLYILVGRVPSLGRFIRVGV